MEKHINIRFIFVLFDQDLRTVCYSICVSIIVERVADVWCLARNGCLCAAVIG